MPAIAKQVLFLLVQVYQRKEKDKDPLILEVYIEFAGGERSVEFSDRVKGGNRNLGVIPGR